MYLFIYLVNYIYIIGRISNFNEILIFVFNLNNKM